MKTCAKCGESKPLEAFGVRKSARDGRRGVCQECRSAQHAAWYQANADERRAKERAYYAAHREHYQEYGLRYRAKRREELRLYQVAYREQNRDRIKRTRRQSYAQHAEKHRAEKKRYREANRTKIHAWNNRRKALQRNAPICDFTAEQWIAMKDAYGHRCAYCGIKPNALTMDHVVPLAKGGSHTASNIVPACLPCNMHKKLGPAPQLVIIPSPPREA